MKTQLSQVHFYWIIHSFPCRRQSKKSIVFSPNRDRNISWPDSSWDNVTVKYMTRPAPTHHSHSSETQGSVCPRPPWAESSRRMSYPKALPRAAESPALTAEREARSFFPSKSPAQPGIHAAGKFCRIINQPRAASELTLQLAVIICLIQLRLGRWIGFPHKSLD